jgi:hypothetical protein
MPPLLTGRADTVAGTGTDGGTPVGGITGTTGGNGMAIAAGGGVCWPAGAAAHPAAESLDGPHVWGGCGTAGAALRA